MASRHVYYDPLNPRMLSDEQIARLSAAEALAACGQIDQNMVGVLHKIDESFNKANDVLLQRILPAVQGYGESSQKVWQSVKFWKSFFEASAAAKLGEPEMGDESVVTEQGALPRGGDESLAFDHDGASNASGPSDQGTPRPPAAQHPWSDDLSPFQKLQSEIQDFGAVPASAASAASSVSQATKEIVRLRLGDLPPDSPDLPVPEFELFGNLSELDSHSKGKGRAYDASASPQPRLKAGADKHHPALLQKLLRKNLASPMAPLGSPTPGKSAKGKTLFPADVPKGWDGRTDLATTSLSAFASPAPLSARGANASAISPPAPLSFEFSHPFSQTPKKEAARRMADDVYNFDSPVYDSPGLEPPSVVKNWATRGYDNVVLPSPSESGRKGFEEEGFEDDESFELPGTVGGALADYGGGGGTTAKIDDLLDDNPFARIVDEDDAGGFHQLPQSQSLEDDGDLFHEDSLVEEELSVNLGPEGPEDTLFGVPQRAGNAQHKNQGFSFHDDKPKAPQGGRFTVMSGHEMDFTLHGGDLLESVPSVSSPLDGRGGS